MRKTNIFLTTAIALVLIASVAFGQINDVSAQNDGLTGTVVAYVPGQSITIVDQQGVQTEFLLDAAVKIEPFDGEKSLTVGSIVTIIAPASLDKGKQKAVGVVVHPEKELLPSATPRIKNTPLPTDPPMTATPKVSDTPTLVESASLTPVETLTATPAVNTKEDGAAVKSNSFIEWLRSLFRQVLSQ